MECLFLLFFIKDHGYSHLTSDPKRSALYVTHLIHKQCSPNCIEIASYAIQWAHVLNVFSRSNWNTFIQSLQDSTKWLNSKPVNKKNTIKSHMIIELCSQFKNLDDLMIFRDLAMIILNCSWFNRFDELSSLKWNDVPFNDHLFEPQDCS